MSDKLLELYIKTFLKGKIEFGGVTLIPNLVKIDDELMVEWDMENPNDVPYTMFPIEERVKDSFFEFCSITGFIGQFYYSSGERRYAKERNEFYKIFKEKIKNFNFKQDYFSPKLKNELDSQLNKVKRVSYLNIEFVYEITYYDLKMYHDEFELFCEVDILEAHMSSSGEDVSWNDLQSFLDNLARKGDIIDLNDIMTDSLDRIIVSYPTFIDRVNMYLSNGVTYLYNGGVIMDK